jgi:glutamine amidotransferase
MKSNLNITIVDYGMGNLRSIENAFRYLGCNTKIVSNALELERDAQTIILPGVGSYRKAMENLRKTNLDDALVELVSQRKKKILGICLGMQLLGESSEEDGVTQGLKLIPGSVKKIIHDGDLKIPHIGFNEVHYPVDSSLFKNISQNSDYYFVHSYCLPPSCSFGKASITNYGNEFMSAYEHENVYGTQFHPEKSQTNGLHLLKNFISS